MTRYTDRTDMNVAISLYEQGCIRDPKTTKTIMMKQYKNDDRFIAVSSPISVDDVIDALYEQDKWFYSYIGESKEECIDSVDNDHLSHYISSLNSYNGWFIE